MTDRRTAWERAWRGPVILALLALLSLLGPTVRARPATIDPSEIHSGMRGTARTVFEGETPRSFQVEFLGVVSGTSPRGDLILFRALGDSLERTGVVHGMSGSPVYVEGKLVGAIAFAFPFSKEPIGLITPIREMLQGFERIDEAPAPWMGSPTASHGRWREAFLTGREATDLWNEWLPSATHGDGSPGLVVMNATGWSDEMFPVLDRFSQRVGLPSPTLGGRTVSSQEPHEPLEAGSAVAVRLVDGDASLAAIGTVTHVEGDRLLAFGHPLFQAGPVELPMSGAWINAVIPSYNSPFKMGSAGKIIGTVRQDLRSGIAGLIGPIPPMLPVRIILEGPSGRRTFHYRLARGLLLEPNLLAWTVSNSFLESGWRVGQATVDARLRLDYNGGEELTRSDRMTSRMPASEIAQALLLPVPLLLSNPFESVDLDSVSLEIAYRPELLETTLVQLSAGKLEYSPGETIRLVARLADRWGETRSVSTEIPVPERWSGQSLLILAGGVNAMTEWDRERAPSLYEPRDLAGIERLIREFPSEDRMLVRVYSEETGVLMADRDIGPLPESVTRVLGSEQKRGSARQAINPMLLEQRIDVDAVVSGGAGIRVRIENRPRR